MAEFHAGSAEVTIVPGMRSFLRDLKKDLREIRQEFGVQIKPKLAEFRTQVRDSLKGTTVRVSVDADLSAARERLRVFAETVRPRVTVDIRFDRNQLGALRGGRYLDVELNIDRTHAHLVMREFMLMYRVLPIRVDVDLTGALAQLAVLQGMAGSLGNLNNSVGSLGAGLAGLVNPATLAVYAIGALAALSLLPLAGQIAHATTALVALGPAAGAAFAGVTAAAVIGSSGVAKAFQAASRASEDAGKAGEQAAQAQASAQRQLAGAVDSAARTHEQGEKRIAAAKQASRDAEDALTRARKQATEQIEDLNLAVTGGALDEEAAQLAVDRAAEKLSEVNAFGSGASRNDRREAELAYRQSIQRLHEVQERNGDLREDLARSDREGVEGSQAVVEAKKRQADAEAAVTDAVKDAARANSDAAQQITEAQQRLAEAFESGLGAADEYAKALANLSPNAADFVTKVRTLGDEWSGLRKQVQDNLFADMGDDVVSLADVQLPTLRDGLSGIATVINDGIRRGLAFLSTDAAKADLTTIFDNSREAVRFLVDGLGDLGAILWDVAAVGSKFLPGLGKDFADAAGSWRDRIHEMREDGSLEKFIGDGIEKFKQLLDIAASVGGMIKNVFVGSNDTGESFLTSIQETVEQWNAWLGSEEGQRKVREFFGEVKDTVYAITGGIETAVDWWGKLVGLADKFGGNPIVQGLSKLFAEDSSIGERITGAFQMTGPGTALTFGWNAVKDKVAEAKEAVTDFADSAGAKLSGFGEWVAGWGRSVAESWRGLTDSVTGGWSDRVRPALDEFRSGLGSLGDSMLARIAGGAVTDWSSLPGSIGSGVSDMVDAAFPKLTEGLGKIRDFFRDVVDAAKRYWSELKDAVREPINYVITSVINGGVGRAWTAVDNFLAGRLPDWVDVPGLARGGLVPLEEGAQRGKDSVLRNLMPGEFVLSVPAVNAAGIGNLAAFNSAALAGGNPSAEGLFNMADGGRVTRDDPAWEAIAKAHEFARAQDGKPYQWAGPNRPGDSFDCSGLMGALTAVLQGKNPWQRYFATSSFTASGGPMGLVPGLGAGLSIGVNDNPNAPGGGHMAGTLSGAEGLPDINVESSSAGVRYGRGATGATDSQFPWRFHLPITEAGSFIDPGPGDAATGTDQRGWIATQAQRLFDKITEPLAGLIRDGVAGLVGDAKLGQLPGTVFESMRGAVREEIGSRIDGLTDGIAGLYDKVKDAAQAANPLNWIPGIVRDQGGVLKPGASIVYNGTGRDEWILSPEWAQRIDELVRALTDPAAPRPVPGPVPDYNPADQAAAAHNIVTAPPPPAPDKWAELGQQSLSKVEAFARDNWQGMAESLLSGVVGAAPTTINAVDVEAAYREMRRYDNMRRNRYRVRI
ncbi:hypothetical protein [Nocardia brasiliensis]|uniref:hypothetical protein n=1 Tax=Nocardia brasiliensis TaxID=37326 RepID=UPI00245898FC|nr:hypothetical protein [Nocardia brasiliensis]